MTQGIDMTGVISPSKWSAVEELLTKQSLTPRHRERLEMVKAAYHGAELREIVRWSGRTDETVRRWLRVFGEGGVDALAAAGRRGLPGGPGHGGRQRSPHLGAVVRRLDLGEVERLSGRDDRHADRAGLAAGAAPSPAVRQRATETLGCSPPGSRRGCRMRRTLAGGGGKR